MERSSSVGKRFEQMRHCNRERSSYSAQNKAARSGNRPRFKRTQLNDFEEEERSVRTQANAQNHRQESTLASASRNRVRLRVHHATTRSSSAPLNRLILATMIIISAILCTSTNCDHQPERPPTLQKRIDRPQLADWETSHLSLSRMRRQSAEEMRVASMATKLEQWFVCQRRSAAGLEFASQLRSSTVISRTIAVATANGSSAIASGSPPTTPPPQEPSLAERGAVQLCPANYDGHLCWPTSVAGERLVRMPCPRVNRLPSERRLTLELPIGASKQAASVISSPAASGSQLAPARKQMVNGSGELIAGGATSEGVSIKSTAAANGVAQDAVNGADEPDALAKFAYRKCDELPPATKPSDNLMRIGKWQLDADYSECRANDLDQFDPTDKWIKLDQEQDKRLFKRLIDELDRIEGAIDPYGDPDLLAQWSLCIANIMRSSNQLANSDHPASSDLWCPIIFDGWRCWPSTRAGDTAYVSCPSNQPGFSAERKAHKICTQNGTWYRHPMTNRYWSNYTTCVDTADLAFRTKILNLYVIGNLISLVALSASLIIFISFKSLNCTRVTIHKNLFLSFITNNLMWIIWYTYVVNDADLLQSNPIACQLWHVLLHYFLVSNYFWMFCEGLYLHTLLVVAFVSEDKILKWFYLLGWLTPIPITIAYAYNRSYDEYYTHFCWMEESPYNLILMTPIGISLLLNLVFLINIVRVLVTKLRANNSPDTHQTRKAVRATLILIPLLGLHYILTPFRPEAKSKWEGIYESIAAVCTSFQGLCVAMLFCFCNAEVITVIKKKLKDTFNLRSSNLKRQNRSGSASAGGGGGNGPYTSTTTAINNCHFNGSNKGARSRNSVISSANPSVGTQSQQKQPKGHQFSGPPNGTNSTTSESSSLLTAITASPIQAPMNNCTTSSLLRVDPSGLTAVACNSNHGKLETAISDLGRPLLASNDGRLSLGLDKEETANLLQHQDQTCSVTTSFSVA